MLVCLVSSLLAMAGFIHAETGQHLIPIHQEQPLSTKHLLLFGAVIALITYLLTTHSLLAPRATSFPSSSPERLQRGLNEERRLNSWMSSSRMQHMVRQCLQRWSDAQVQPIATGNKHPLPVPSWWSDRFRFVRSRVVHHMCDLIYQRLLHCGADKGWISYVTSIIDPHSHHVQLDVKTRLVVMAQSCVLGCLRSGSVYLSHRWARLSPNSANSLESPKPAVDDEVPET